MMEKDNLKTAFLLVTITYILAIICAIIVGFLFRDLHPIIIALVADIAATLVVYFISIIFKNSSFYDAYWSIAPLVILIYYLFNPENGSVVFARQLMVILLLSLWAVRLTWNWASHWKGLKHEDWRYVDFRNNSPKLFWIINLFGIHLMPTMMVFVGCLSVYPAVSTGTAQINILDIIGILITLGAIILETVADIQLHKFRAEESNQEKVNNVGLFAYSRHPNYLGEICFWWGLFIFGISADSTYWWTIIGPLSITLLFIFISIPIMEKHNAKKRSTYAEYMQSVSILIPWKRKLNEKK